MEHREPPSQTRSELNPIQGHGVERKEDVDRQFATTLARGLDLLRCFTPGSPVLGNKDISARTGLTRPTVSRLTYTLTKLGYLRHDVRSGKYQLGSAVLSLGYPLFASMTVRQVARPMMEELAGYCNGAVSMAVRDRLNMVYIETCRGTNVLATMPDIGRSAPIALGLSGRAFLAGCSATEREAVINQIKVKEPETYRKNLAPIHKAIEEIRTHGYCLSSREGTAPNHGVGTPIRRPFSAEVISFTCVVPAGLLKKGQLEQEIGPRLVALARNVEHSLGLHL